MGAFLQKNLSAILSIAVSALVSLGGWVWATAAAKGELEQVKAKVEQFEKEGSSFEKQTRWTVEAVSRDQTKSEVKIDAAASAISEIKSDVRVIKDWVDEQKRRDRKP